MVVHTVARTPEDTLGLEQPAVPPPPDQELVRPRKGIADATLYKKVSSSSSLSRPSTPRGLLRLLCSMLSLFAGSWRPSTASNPGRIDPSLLQTFQAMQISCYCGLNLLHTVGGPRKRISHNPIGFSGSISSKTEHALSMTILLCAVANVGLSGSSTQQFSSRSQSTSNNVAYLFTVASTRFHDAGQAALIDMHRHS